MGFFKDVGNAVAKAVSLPVTGVAKVTSNVIREGGEAFGFQAVSQPLSSLLGTPYSAIQKGEGFSAVLPTIQQSVSQLAPLATSIGGAVASGGLTASSALSALKGFTGTPPGELTQPTDSMPAATNTTTNVPVLQGADYTMPVIIGGAALLGFILLRRK